MGKATVIAGGEGGLYTIKLANNREFIESEIALLEEYLPNLREVLDEQEEYLKYQELTVEEQRMAIDALIDQLEQFGPADGGDIGAVVSLHNTRRASLGRSQLTVSGPLQSAAQSHADWMRDGDVVGHTGANGSSPRQRAVAAGYVPGVVGENVTAGFPNSNSMFDSLMRSPGHRENIEWPEWTQIGVGYAYCPGGLYRHFWAVKYGVPS